MRIYSVTNNSMTPSEPEMNIYVVLSTSLEPAGELSLLEQFSKIKPIEIKLKN